MCLYLLQDFEFDLDQLLVAGSSVVACKPIGIPGARVFGCAGAILAWAWACAIAGQLADVAKRGLNLLCKKFACVVPVADSGAVLGTFIGDAIQKVARACSSVAVEVSVVLTEIAVELPPFGSAAIKEAQHCNPIVKLLSAVERCKLEGRSQHNFAAACNLFPNGGSPFFEGTQDANASKWCCVSIAGEGAGAGPIAVVIFVAGGVLADQSRGTI